MNALLRIMLSLIALVLCVFTVMPLVRTNVWWVRIFDFPRVQITVVMVVVLLAWGVVYMMARRREHSEAGDAGPDKGWHRVAAFVPVLLLVALFWQGYRIFPYTPLASYQVEYVKGAERADTVRLLINNVRYDNRQTDELLETIEKSDPDLILLVEPTQWWAD